jgi:hypothetical protein
MHDVNIHRKTFKEKNVTIINGEENWKIEESENSRQNREINSIEVKGKAWR